MFQALRRIQVAASDFPRSRRFYGETLGLPEIGSFESDWAEFGLGPVILKLIPLRPGEVPARNQVATVLSTDTMEATLTTLKERGVTVTRGAMDEFTGRSAEILDPDGYRIIVFQASELHPDEEWVPMSQVDETVKQKLASRLQKQKGKGDKAPPAKKAAPKAAPKKPAPAPRKPAPKKAAAKAAPKKAAPRKASPKKSAPKNSAAKKSAPKKAAPKKAAPKKATPKKPAPRKAAARKPAPKKSAPKKPAPKKSGAKKPAPKKPFNKR